ncbi:exonuclease domain-containing protein [Flavobacteriaceae bacterium KMM 6898]|nr:exonuclease domain-containing protein [Flavobacteriaceae bacterium KMM 6898]
MLYTVIDIETTGNGVKGNRITEIAIFKYDGDSIVDEFTSLVNPECEIPYFITGLTGIDNSMVRNAPKLVEITDKILAITKDTIFVAHNVNFDYNIIKNQFQELGIAFSRKKLCTIRLSRKLVPGLHSYSLGKLCTSLDIPLTDRHRARGDAHATVLLLERLLNTEGAESIFQGFLNSRSQEATLPPALSKMNFDALPSSSGVYFFKNAKKKIIYVGKANNIKKRVLGHFYDKSSKEMTMCQETAHIDFELSGSELLALLMESAAIKHHFPQYNQSQKKPSQQYGVFTYEDRNGILHMAFNKLKQAPNTFVTFNNITESRAYLEQVCLDFLLCPKYCHLQENVAVCSHYKIPTCGGICRDKEPIDSYNEKVRAAVAHIIAKNDDIIIKEKGRNPEEEAFVLIKNGQYSGYGFIERENTITTLEDIDAFINPQNDNLDTQRILKSYLSKNTLNVIPLMKLFGQY